TDVLTVATVNGLAANVGTQFTTAQGGTLTVNANGSFSYQNPSALTDSFSYTATDGTLTSNTAIVTITVSAAPNLPPVAHTDTYPTPENQLLGVAAPGVLGNSGGGQDTDPNGDTLAVATVSGVAAGTVGQPVATAHGSVTIQSNGSFFYTPANNYSGPDSFT